MELPGEVVPARAEDNRPVRQRACPVGEPRGKAVGFDCLALATQKIRRLLSDLPTVAARENEGQQAGIILSAICHHGAG